VAPAGDGPSGPVTVGDVPRALVSGLAAMAPVPGEGGHSVRVCPYRGAQVPEAVPAAAGADPATVPGWGQPCNPDLPLSPLIPARTHLGLVHPNFPYHPLHNSLVFKCGCP